MAEFSAQRGREHTIQMLLSLLGSGALGDLATACVVDECAIPYVMPTAWAIGTASLEGKGARGAFSIGLLGGQARGNRALFDRVALRWQGIYRLDPTLFLGVALGQQG